MGIFSTHQSDGAVWPASAAARPVTAGGLGALGALDRAVFGADRERVLARLLTFAERFVECGEPVGGYAAAWANGDITMIGPLVAPDVTTAATLISHLAGGLAGPVRVDIAGRHAGLAGWVQAHGLLAGSETTLMAHGGPLPGHRARLFAPVSVAIG
jgi:hypothetical protein